MSDRERLSFATEDAVAGASFFDDVDVEIVDAEAKLVDYVKKDGTVTATGVPAVVVTYKPLVDGGEQHQFEERYSAGGSDRIQPTEDGTGFKPAAGKTWDDVKGLVETSRFVQFSGELQRVGYPAARLKTGNVKDLIGLKGHLLKIDPPKKAGSGSSDKNKLAVITKIIELPGAQAATANSVDKEAIGFLQAVVAKACTDGKRVTVSQLGTTANKKFAGTKNLLAIVSKVLDTKLLASQQGWSYDGKSIGAPAADDSIEV
jgi:hypothetical protein